MYKTLMILCLSFILSSCTLQTVQPQVSTEVIQEVTSIICNSSVTRYPREYIEELFAGDAYYIILDKMMPYTDGWTTDIHVNSDDTIYNVDVLEQGTDPEGTFQYRILMTDGSFKYWYFLSFNRDMKVIDFTSKPYKEGDI